MKKIIARLAILCLVLVLAVGTALAAGTEYVTGIEISGSGGTLALGTSTTLTAQPTIATCETHTFGEWTVVTPASCGTTGVQKHTCSTCGTVEYGSVPVTGAAHQWGEGVPDEKAGTTTYACSVCRATSVAYGDQTASNGSITLPSTSPTVPETETPSTTVTWRSTNTAVVTVDGGVVKAVGAGTADVYAEAGTASDHVTFTVGEVAIVAGNLEIKAGNSKTFSTSLSGVPDNTEISWSFSSNSDLITVDSTSGRVTAAKNTNGLATVEITAKYTPTGGSEQTIRKTAYVSVYDERDIAAVMKTGVSTFKLGDYCKDVFTSVKIDSDSYNYATVSSNTLANLLSANDMGAIDFGKTGTSVGSFSASSTNSPSTLTFTAQSVGTVTYSYKVYANVSGSTTALKVREGQLSIEVTDGVGDIIYTTDRNTKVTFDEDDFLEFWEDQDFDSDLDYVQFGVSSQYPQYGELNKTSSSTVDVLRTEFYRPNYTTTKDYYDLDTVTYVPDPYETGVQSVTIPFTCQGEDADEKASGVVLIQLDDTAMKITSRGVVFGSEDYDVVGMMKDVFKAATGNTLSYVTFSTVSAEDGKLFNSFSGMLNSTEVSKNTKFYVSTASTSDMALKNVTFVPRAGLTGKVSIYFTGYSGSNESTSCYITFDVQEKTKSSVFSDVNASSYSWAADSVDFLHYEKVANGSNGKYNPASNITRGDFMLMLYRAFLEDEYGDYNVTSNFPDVVKGSDSYSKETYQAVGVAKYLGIAQGSNGKYNPKAYITREEAMTLIYRTLDEVGYSMSYTVSTDTSDFSDYSSVSSYAKTAISDLIEHGVVIGTSGKIQPKSNITRAEMAVILHRVLTY